LDLFSGIGGFSLGLERTGGFQTVAFCEIDPFCRKVLMKHWPKVPCYHDVRELTAERLRADGIVPDVICGGFPCQDISLAGKGAGLDGERSGLWSEIARLAGELRPRFLIVENVSALLARGLDRVLGDLAEIGVDAEWHCIPASAVGAPHRRDRVWLVAYPNAERLEGTKLQRQRVGKQPRAGYEGGDVANADGSEWRALSGACGRVEGQQRLPQGQEGSGGLKPSREDVADANGAGLQNRIAVRLRQELATPPSDGWWRVEPDVGRVAHGVPSRVDRLRALGNAVVPQIPELIGRAILAAEA
jgi:DNA (cytosine-5)-methyltransferase 1